MGVGFTAYCSSTLNVVKDPSFLLTVSSIVSHSRPSPLTPQCENVVVPAFVEYLLRHNGRISTSKCSVLVEGIDSSLHFQQCVTIYTKNGTPFLPQGKGGRSSRYQLRPPFVHKFSFFIEPSCVTYASLHRASKSRRQPSVAKSSSWSFTRLLHI